MPTFIYRARNTKGEEKKGAEEVQSQKELALRLRAQGFFLVEVEKAGAGEEKTKKWTQIDIGKIVSRFRWVSLTEKMLFARHLGVMVGAGLSLTRALEVLARQSKSVKLKKAIRDIEQSVREGQFFSDGLAEHPKIFDELFVNMMRVAETGGNMEEALNLLAEQLRKEHELRSKVLGAMVYPAVIVAAMTGIGILMMIFVVPQLTATFADLGVELPFTTKIIIGLSRALTNNTIVFFGGLFGSIYLTYKISQTPEGKEKVHWFLLKMPIFSGLVKKINSARIVRTLSSLIQAGVPIVKSIRIAANTTTNNFYKRSLEEAGGSVEKGNKLSDALAGYPDIYPLLVTQMIEVGEETGSLGEILRKLAEFFEEEVANATKSLASIIEPVLMIVIGAAVGFFAISMLQPMYTLIGNL